MTHCQHERELAVERERSATLLKANSILRESQLELLERYRLATVEHAAMLSQLQRKPAVEAAMLQDAHQLLQNAAFGIEQAHQTSARKEEEIAALRTELAEAARRNDLLEQAAANHKEAADKLVAEVDAMRAQLTHQTRLARQYELALESERLGTSKHRAATMNSKTNGASTSPLFNATLQSSHSDGSVLPSVEPMKALVTQLERIANGSAVLVAVDRLAGAQSNQSTTPPERHRTAAESKYSEMDVTPENRRLLERKTLELAHQARALEEVCTARPELRCALEKIHAIDTRNRQLRNQLRGLSDHADSDADLQRALFQMHKTFWHARAEEAVETALSAKAEALQLLSQRST